MKFLHCSAVLFLDARVRRPSFTFRLLQRFFLKITGIYPAGFGWFAGAAFFVKIGAAGHGVFIEDGSVALHSGVFLLE